MDQMRLVDESKTWGPLIVCEVAGVARATFHSWLSRQYLPLRPSLGMGRERQFCFLDVVRISIAAALTRMNINIGTAGRFSGMIGHRQIYGSPLPGIDRPEERWTLLLVPTPAAGEPAEEKEVLVIEEGDIVGINSLLTPRSDPESINRSLDFCFPGGRPEAFMTLDVAAVVARVRAALEHRADSPSGEGAGEVGFGQATG